MGTPMERDKPDSYQVFARPYYAGKDPAHDFCHIERILARLDRLAAGLHPAPRPDRLFFLACFHGVETLVRTDRQVREEVCARLRGLGWSETEVTEGLESLRRHLIDPQTTEEKMVHDANYLELLGALGIAKAFTTGGARGQRIEESAAIFEEQYLDRVAFRTPRGERLADEGRAYVKAFLGRLRRELENSFGACVSRESLPDGEV